MVWQIKDGVVSDTSFPFTHGTTTVHYGTMRDAVNREMFCSRAGIDFKRLVTLEQTHSTDIIIATERHGGQQFPTADGLITIVPKLPLGVFTADCIPVFMADTQKRIVAMVHAGWRGVARGIIVQAATILKRDFNSNPADIHALLGPHMMKCCFEIGDEVRTAFNLPAQQTHADVTAIAVKQLVDAGITQVSVSPYCTAHQKDLFFSFRRDKTTDRMMSFIQL